MKISNRLNIIGVIIYVVFRFRYEKAELEIQQHEQQSPLAIQSEVKPFTTKAPVHVIEALDTVAEEFGMSRNAFVLKLLEVYLGSAYVDYQNGYGVPFNEDPHAFLYLN